MSFRRVLAFGVVSVGLAVVLGSMWLYEHGIVNHHVCHDGQKRVGYLPCDFDEREDGVCTWSDPDHTRTVAKIEVGDSRRWSIRGWPQEFVCEPPLPESPPEPAAEWWKDVPAPAQVETPEDAGAEARREHFEERGIVTHRGEGTEDFMKSMDEYAARSRAAMEKSQGSCAKNQQRLYE